MDENEALGGDPSEQFHRNEAISAVADEGFLGEEEDDYEDLYNDVNVGENFLQSLRGNEDNLGHRNQEQPTSVVPASTPTSTAPPPPPLPPAPPQQLLPVKSGGLALPDEGASSGVPDREEGYQTIGFRENSNTSNIGAGRGAGTPAGAGSAGGLRVELVQPSSKAADLEEPAVSTVLNIQQVVHNPPPQQQTRLGNMGSAENARNVNGTGGNVYGGDSRGGVAVIGGGVGGGGGGTFLFVGDLHWWTTDAELESVLCKFGPVKEVKFFDERASGKSKGYCQVEFFDPAAATACKEGMNGHVFNGRPCVVAYASPYTVKRMGEAQVNRNQQQMGPAAVNQPRRGPGDLSGKSGGVVNNMTSAGNHPAVGDNNGRGFGRGNWGRGNNPGGMGNRGPMGPMRNRGPGGMGVRGMSASPLLHPQAMMGQGFDPAFGGPMGRMGGYGGFPGGPAAPFPGILSSFGPVGNVGLPGVAPHVNPAFFGRGMPMNGMGMMPNPGVEGPNMGMWSDPNMGGWAGDEHGGRAGESSYGEEAASDHQYGEGSQDRGPWPSAAKEKDRGSERDWSGSSERRYKEERDSFREKDMGRDNEWSERRNRDEKALGRDRQSVRERDRERSLDHEQCGGRERERERYKDDRDRYVDHHRHRSREREYDDEWDRERSSSRTHGKSRVSHEEEHRSRSRDADYGKRRRLTSD
ncbi:RNA-binding protein [Striga asiatica]|uniref:RNA-binding protein n=1 Tax=Striga asiatica TaxID=4170 RepID=A0A5A7PIL5_STRAF|nr:RNA-binding protein [Striga asiatica]